VHGRANDFPSFRTHVQSFFTWAPADRCHHSKNHLPLPGNGAIPSGAARLGLEAPQCTASTSSLLLGPGKAICMYVCRRLNLGRIRKDIDNSRSNLGTLQNTHSWYVARRIS
jgi:hypothetical protein